MVSPIMNCSSVRNRPMPSAPDSSRCGMSSSSPAFIISLMATPSRVTAGRSRTAAKRAWAWTRKVALGLEGRRRFRRRAADAPRRSRHRPRWCRRRAQRRRCPPATPTRGMPIERATMATWRGGGGLFQHQSRQPVAAIIQQFGRAHAARHQHGIGRQAAVAWHPRRSGGAAAAGPDRRNRGPARAGWDRPGAGRAGGFRPARVRPPLRRSGRCAPHRACAGASPGRRRTGDRPRSPRGLRR